MSILVECPHCEKRFQEERYSAGRVIQCPECKRDIKIPEAAKTAEVKEARIIGPAPADDASVPDSGEDTVLEFQPAGRAYLGWIILGIVLCVVVVGVFILLGVLIATKSRRYRVTNQRLLVTTGLIARKTDELELFRIKDLKIDQGIWQRILNFGTIVVISTDETTPQLNIAGIGNPVEVKEKLRTLYRAARKAEGVKPTEFIES